MPNGLLIAFEGIPGSPARRHLDLFSTYLHTRQIQHESVHFLDPSAPIGSLTFLAYHDMFANFNRHTTQLLMDAERWTKRDFIVSTLKSGIHVLIDRYTLCSIAESVAEHLTPTIFDQDKKEELPRPDLVFYFEHTSEESILSLPYSHITTVDKIERIKKAYEHAIDYYTYFKDILFILPREIESTTHNIQAIIRQHFYHHLKIESSDN